MTSLLLIEAGHLITKRGSPVMARITVFGVTGVITQTVIITGVTTDHDPITGVTIRDLTTTEAILQEDPIAVIIVVIPLGDPGLAAVTIEAIPLPEEVLHQSRLEAGLEVHPVHPEKGKIKIPG